MNKKIGLLLLVGGLLQRGVLANEHKITEKPLELSILAIQNGKTYDENWTVFQEAFKDTNVK